MSYIKFCKTVNNKPFDDERSAKELREAAEEAKQKCEQFRKEQQFKRKQQEIKDQNERHAFCVRVFCTVIFIVGVLLVPSYTDRKQKRGTSKYIQSLKASIKKRDEKFSIDYAYLTDLERDNERLCNIVKQSDYCPILGSIVVGRLDEDSIQTAIKEAEAENDRLYKLLNKGVK